MRALTLTAAKEYAHSQFTQLPPLQQEWNRIHSEGIIHILTLLPHHGIDLECLFALAWVHDVGKVRTDEGHAQHSWDMLSEVFDLNAVDKECILHHGSTGTPVTPEGRLFRYADGLSLFLPRTTRFFCFAQGQEGKSFEQMEQNWSVWEKKYEKAYADSKEAISLLRRLNQPLHQD